MLDTVRAATHALARELTARGAVGIPAYTLIPKELTRDKAKAKEFVDKNGNTKLPQRYWDGFWFGLDGRLPYDIKVGGGVDLGGGGARGHPGRGAEQPEHEPGTRW